MALPICVDRVTALFCSSFPRRRESSSYLVFRFSLTASVRFSARVRRAGHFLLLVQEKVTKENTPRMPRPPRYALRVREGMPGSADCTSLCRQRNRRDPSRRPCGRFRHALAAANRDPKIKSQSNGVRGFLLLRAGARCFGSSGSPLHCGGSGRRGPAGVRAMDRAHSVASTGTCCQRNPAADVDRSWRMHERRNALGCISLVTFFVQAKKVTRSSAGRVEALTL